MEGEEGFLARKKKDWRSHLFRAPARRRWGLVGLAISFVMIYAGLATDAPRTGPTAFPPFGILEGMGVLFGSLAELMPEEQTTLAGILRVWAGLFAICGLTVMVAGPVAGFGP